VTSFVKEEVDGEGRRQDDLATTFQVDRIEKQLYFRPTVERYT